MWVLGSSLLKIEMSESRTGLEKALKECPQLLHLSCSFSSVDVHTQADCQFDNIVAVKLTKVLPIITLILTSPSYHCCIAST